jgi:hypothetical protein
MRDDYSGGLKRFARRLTFRGGRGRAVCYQERGLNERIGDPIRQQTERNFALTKNDSPETRKPFAKNFELTLN